MYECKVFSAKIFPVLFVWCTNINLVILSLIEKKSTAWFAFSDYRSLAFVIHDSEPVYCYKMHMMILIPTLIQAQYKKCMFFFSILNNECIHWNLNLIYILKPHPNPPSRIRPHHLTILVKSKYIFKIYAYFVSIYMYNNIIIRHEKLLVVCFIKHSSKYNPIIQSSSAKDALCQVSLQLT